MTVASTSSRMPPYEGNGAAIAFPITFPFPANETIRAILQRPGEDGVDLVLDTDFTLTGAGEDEGGTLTFPKAGSAYSTLAAGEYLHIMRVVPLTQERDWNNVDGLDAEQIEAGDDRLTMIGQQLQEQLDRALVFPVTTEPETDPATYAEQVTTARDQAAASAASAGSSASTAGAHATTATTQAGIATTQANNAATSASTSSTKADEAAASAAAALASAEDAFDSADAADTSATAAAASAAEAEAWATEVGAVLGDYGLITEAEGETLDYGSIA